MRRMRGSGCGTGIRTDLVRYAHAFTEEKNMQFGYFDNENLEYVITRPDTPGPWANYLGSPEYGALISDHAG